MVAPFNRAAVQALRADVDAGETEAKKRGFAYVRTKIKNSVIRKNEFQRVRRIRGITP